MIVAFEFDRYNKPLNYFVCSYSENEPFSVMPPKPKRREINDCLFPKFTHLFELTEQQLNDVWQNKSNYTLEGDNLVGLGVNIKPLSILECDWNNGYEINSDGFINKNHVVFQDEKPPEYVVMKHPPLDFKKPKWTGVEWVEGYVEEVKEPTELELLQQENEQLKTEIEQHKTEANVATQAIFELALEIESLKGGA